MANLVAPAECAAFGPGITHPLKTIGRVSISSVLDGRRPTTLARRNFRGNMQHAEALSSMQ
jgi:hypothetical protein